MHSSWLKIECTALKTMVDTDGVLIENDDQREQDHGENEMDRTLRGAVREPWLFVPTKTQQVTQQQENARIEKRPVHTLRIPPFQLSPHLSNSSLTCGTFVVDWLSSVYSSGMLRWSSRVLFHEVSHEYWPNRIWNGRSAE